MAKALEHLYHDLLKSFVKLLELRNPFNIDHCQLVAEHCGQLARFVDFPSADVERLVRAADIHTLGVLLQMEEKQPDRHLPISGLGDSSGREVSIHQREEEIFRGILSPVPWLGDCLEILEQRHEWYDGTGSIAGYSGQEICKEARLMAVIDAYVDLVTPKAHRPPETITTALERLDELAGLQFDPFYVDALRRCLAQEPQDLSRARERKFQVAHCRHYLGLGHFYTQIQENEWALRSYLAAERLAARMRDPGLELGAISGQFMVFCQRRELERARELLRQVGSRGTTDRDLLGYQLLWGLLEWLEGKPLGKEILREVIAKHEALGNLPGYTAALAFQTCMTLFFQGSEDPEHQLYLGQFMELVASHDVFDVVERYRPYTIPVLLSAVVLDSRGRLARNLLTRMGEPCHGPVQERLKNVPPSRWSEVLMSTPVLGSAPAVPAGANQGEPLYITTLGPLSFAYGPNRVGVEGWATLKTISLFLRLAFSAGQLICGDTLAEELWPDAGLKKGRDSLRNGLAQVRKAVRTLVGDDNLEVVSRSRKHDTLALELPCRFDFEDFEAACAGFREATDSSGALARAQKALAFYKGDFLEGFDLDWVVAKRSRLAALRVQALAWVAGCHLKAGDHSQAEHCARELLALDDLREESHCLLIEALAGSGRSAEAIAHYEKAQELFETEIGVFPERLRVTLKDLSLLL